MWFEVADCAIKWLFYIEIYGILVYCGGRLRTGDHGSLVWGITMFRGSYSNSIDAKGRCIIPAKFRHELGDRCVLVKGFDECLYLYTDQEWQDYMNTYLVNFSDEDEAAHDLKLFFYGNSIECEIDRQGRINLPQDYINYAGIEKEMVNVGFRDKVEVWGKEKYEAKMSSEEMKPRNLLRKIRESREQS
jgi:MraZ protein